MKIKEMEELFRQRAEHLSAVKKIEEEIEAAISPRRGKAPGSARKRPEKKHRKNSLKNSSDSKVCTDCGEDSEKLIKGMCPKCYFRNRNKSKKDHGSGNMKDVYRYQCIDCEHKWTSFNDPLDESKRDKCPECNSSMVKW